MIDHHKRADRLRDFIDSLSKVAVEHLDQQDVTLDGEIPNVPCRYALSAYDGSSTMLNFADTLEDAAEIAADLGDDYPWAPGEMIDLDTGVPYEPTVKVAFTAKRWLVHASPADSDLVFDVRFTSEEQAREYIGDEATWTVLDSEPIDTLAEVPYA